MTTESREAVASLLVERAGPVTTLILNRPDKRNALDAGLVDGLLAAVERAGADGTRLLVLRARGPAFCGGFDFTGLEAQSEGDIVLRFLRLEMLLQALYHAPLATIALAQGACMGAGADLVGVCGRRVATPDARFRMPGLGFGVVLGTRRLAQLVGGDAARDLLEASRSFTGKEALRLGFLTGIAEAASWEAMLEQARDAALVLDYEARRSLEALTTPDSRDADLAALARSLVRPGLKDRMLAYRQGLGRRAK